MHKFLHISGLLLWFLLLTPVAARANASSVAEKQEGNLDVKEFILHHVADAYEWHITNIGGKDITIPLPVIVYSSNTGWHIFMSSKFHQHPVYSGLFIAHEGKFAGKIIETDKNGIEQRPFDISITKIALSLILSSTLLILLIMGVARAYKKQGYNPKGKFIALMELFIVDIYESIIKPCVGKDYKRYAPYLLTLFFFVFINNVMGLIPFFPGGANVTGNIAVTFILAFVTFLIVNISGTKEYWKEILWPDVPTWLKAPVPLMPAIELVGVFMKPFALMIRLFANMLAGHSIALALTCIIFVTVKMGIAMNSGMTAIAIFFSVFLSFVEILVAYIQAYVFTMLTAVFISLARVESHHKTDKKILTTNKN
ncbi:MAG: ATP synthase F0 subunit A [Bacteroidetes bacterium GWF2_49_14]|nr:MAG: ATP synthase F0 subunit A [Bacteroidetes bacterium GWF2_49_14]